MIPKRDVINSRLNEVGKKFDYRKKEILFDRFKGWFDGIAFAQYSMSMGWGKYESSDGSLIIGTACFDGGEWLDTVQHTSKANNPHNNYVNAIAYWDMLNEKGKTFFLDFYKQDFVMLKYEVSNKIAGLESQIISLNKKLSEINTEINSLQIINS